MIFIIFDFDGTLVDSQDVIYSSMCSAFSAVDLAPPSRAAVRSIIGLSIELAIARIAPPDTPETIVQDIVEHYKNDFIGSQRQKHAISPLFEHAYASVTALHQQEYCLGIATGKSMRGLEAALPAYNMTHMFSTLQTACRHPSKPHPSMIIEAMQDTAHTPEQTIMIGDTTFDIQMARNAGVYSLGVSWGYHAITDLQAAGAHLIVHSFDQLVAECQKFAALSVNDRQKLVHKDFKI